MKRYQIGKKIYSKISSMYKKKIEEKINVILDTDTYNECDDHNIMLKKLIN